MSSISPENSKLALFCSIMPIKAETSAIVSKVLTNNADAQRDQIEDWKRTVFRAGVSDIPELHGLYDRSCEALLHTPAAHRAALLLTFPATRESRTLHAVLHLPTNPLHVIVFIDYVEKETDRFHGGNAITDLKPGVTIEKAMQNFLQAFNTPSKVGTPRPYIGPELKTKILNGMRPVFSEVPAGADVLLMTHIIDVPRDNSAITIFQYK